MVDTLSPDGRIIGNNIHSSHQSQWQLIHASLRPFHLSGKRYVAGSAYSEIHWIPIIHPMAEHVYLLRQHRAPRAHRDSFSNSTQCSFHTLASRASRCQDSDCSIRTFQSSYDPQHSEIALHRRSITIYAIKHISIQIQKVVVLVASAGDTTNRLHFMSQL